MKLKLECDLDEAIEKTKFGKFNCIMVALFGLILTCGFLETLSINMVLPIAECELNLTNFHKGFLGSVSYIGILLSSHLWGFLADTKGRKMIIVPALLFSFLFSVISTFAKSFWFLAFFRFLNGFCICAPQTVTYAYLGEFYSIKNRSRALLVASVIYSLFCLISPLNGILFLNQSNWTVYIPYLDISYSSWRLFLLMCAVPSVISAVALIIFIPESPKFLFSQGDELATLEILRKIYVWNTGKSTDEYEVEKLISSEENQVNSDKSSGFFSFMWSQTVPLFQHPHLKNMLTACYLQFGILFVANGFWTFLPEILNKVSIWTENSQSDPATICNIYQSLDTNFNSTIASPSNSEITSCKTNLEISTLKNVAILFIASTIALLVIVFLVKRVGKVKIIVTIMFICGICSISLGFIQIPQLSIYVYFAFLLVISNLSVVNASTVELFPTSQRAMAVSISMMAGRIGSVVGSNFVGILIKNFCNYTWILPSFLLFSGGLLAFTIPSADQK